MELLEFWYVFPIALIICTTACTLAMEGAVLFTPTFLFLLPALSAAFPGLAPFPPFTPYEAIGVALVLEFFGYSSSASGYLRERLVDFGIVRAVLVLSVPVAIATRLVAAYFPAKLLLLLFGGMLLVLAVIQARTLSGTGPGAGEACDLPGSRTLVSRRGREYLYAFRSGWKERSVSSIAGGFIGIIGVGMGELVSTLLLVRHRLPAQVAVGTAVFAVAVTVLTAATTHVFVLAQAGGSLPWSVLAWLIPAVLIGGQIAPKICAVTPERVLRLALIVMFVLVSGVMIFRGLTIV